MLTQFDMKVYLALQRAGEKRKNGVRGMIEGRRNGSRES